MAYNIANERVLVWQNPLILLPCQELCLPLDPLTRFLLISVNLQMISGGLERIDPWGGKETLLKTMGQLGLSICNESDRQVPIGLPDAINHYFISNF